MAYRNANVADRNASVAYRNANEIRVSKECMHGLVLLYSKRFLKKSTTKMYRDGGWLDALADKVHKQGEHILQHCTQPSLHK